jgi:predicted porin
MLTPALAASNQPQKAKKARIAAPFSIGSFTPAVADPRLAAEFARRGVQPSSFRFTPSSASPDKSKAVKVAVRARAATPAQAVRTLNESSASPVTAITPTAYNLGVAVGWKRFALTGDVAKVQGGTVPGGREAAEVGVSYAGNKFTGRVNVAAERSEGPQRVVPIESSYSLDVGGSYDVGKNLAVTGGVRYKIERDRLQPLADDRRDSQAVYVGTAFRF